MSHNQEGMYRPDDVNILTRLRDALEQMTGPSSQNVQIFWNLEHHGKSIHISTIKLGMKSTSVVNCEIEF